MRVPAIESNATDLAIVRAAYGSVAQEYIDRFGSADRATLTDRDVMRVWSASVTGPVLDVGCGPGHWSAFLRSLGTQVEGIDATPAFIEHAAAAYPEVAFRLGDLRTVDLEPASLGGVLAWFSMIHIVPEQIPAVLRRFADALQPGGSILLGFFSAERLEAFEHRVVTAWSWPLGWIMEAIDRAGLEVTVANEHPQPTGRTFAELVARRPD